MVKFNGMLQHRPLPKSITVLYQAGGSPVSIRKGREKVLDGSDQWLKWLGIIGVLNDF